MSVSMLCDSRRRWGTIDIHDILNRLEGVKGGNGQWSARCPAHDDQRSSLSVSIGAGGRVLLKCHAGCSIGEITAALGLTMKDLFAEQKINKPVIVAIYDYRDGDGKLLAQKLRYSDKHFSWRRPVAGGRWEYNRKGVPHRLYVAGELDGLVHVMEGEKDADNFHAQIGGCAVSGADGAGPGKWRKEYTKQLQGRSVVILCDNDDVGRAYAQETAAALHGMAKSVQVVDLSQIWPEIPEHGDVSDLIGAKGAAETARLLTALEKCTPEWEPVPQIYQNAAGSGYSLNWDETPSSVKPPDYSDAGNAAVFSIVYRDDLIFVDALGWLYWNGHHWERDDHHALSCALELSERMLKEAIARYGEAQQLQAEAMTRFAETGDDEDKDDVTTAKESVKKAGAYLAHAKNLRGATRLKNMMELSKPAFVLKAYKLDANPFDLNTPAGIINLTTGQLRPHERTAYCSQITRAAPGTQGRDMWESFLDTVTCNDGGLKGFLQMVAGMAFIGSVYQEGIVIACGGGRNGKSTTFNAIGDALGDYAGTIDIKTITTDRANKGASLATLRGKRLVITGELEEHQRLSVATLKQVASTDKLTIEEKYKQPETVKQSHTLLLFTNHLPRVGSTDSGTWRRLIVVPFNAVIQPGSGVQNYGEVLAKECGGAILAWGIEGAVNFVRNGFKLDIPDAVAEATEEYRQREDWLTNFINERCIRDPNAREGARALYLEYKAWAQDGGEFVRRESDFAAAMEKAELRKVTIRGKPHYYGLRIDRGAYCQNPYNARA